MIIAGTAIRGAIEIIGKEGRKLVDIIVAFDRVEKTLSATDDDGAPA